MKKTTVAFILLMTIMAVFISFSFNVRIAQAQGDYDILYVNHEVEVLNNGYVLINDTVSLNVTGQPPSNFLMGFPYTYGQNVLRTVAYNASDVFPITPNVPLENRLGFYGVRVDFPSGIPEVFTVEFALSNSLVSLTPDNVSIYRLDFPAYPSFVKPVGICNVSIVLPKDGIYLDGTTGGLAYERANLPEFADSPAHVDFSFVVGSLQIMDVNEFLREIRINEFNEIDGSDSYYITNRDEDSMNFTQVILPMNASSIGVQDQFGRKMADPTNVDPELNQYRVVFQLPVDPNNSTRFTVKYELPSKYIEQESSGSFVFNVSMFQPLNYYVAQASMAFILPEGARMVSFEDTLNADTRSISRNVFQETATLTKQRVIPLDASTVEILYNYNPLWLSFRPTMWIWALSIIGAAVVVVWKRPKAPSQVILPKVVVKLTPEYLRSFVDAYEEKMKITSEINSIETRVRKGKIPRRRYKVLRKTLEARLDTLSRDFEESKAKMRAAGGKYSELMRQLEISEAQISEADTNVESIEARHARGEVTLETYRKLLSDYQRRKEEAETTIKGILLRLREEIR